MVYTPSRLLDLAFEMKKEKKIIYVLPKNSRFKGSPSFKECTHYTLC